ncbi:MULTISPECIES: hypothetical protein [Pseudomonas]|nr:MULTISPECIES: hypothetical protein [Pseudomonas]
MSNFQPYRQAGMAPACLKKARRYPLTIAELVLLFCLEVLLWTA